MKKSYLIMAAIASLALVSCSDEEFVGNPELGPGQGKTAEIVFNSVGKGMTRADFTGQDAADKLNRNFVFAGTKNDGTRADEYVFDQYNANWVINTANTTESNSNDWEYVGYTPATTSAINTTQTIKYWDYGKTQYDFAAYSLGGGNATATKIKFSTLSSDAYKLTGSVEDLKACYISDLVTAYNKTANNHTGNDFGKVVTFSFRSLATKIRLAFYETVPGYSVKDIQFYSAATGGTATTTPTLFASSAVLPSGSGTMTVTFPHTGWALSPNGETPNTDYNKAHVTFAQADQVDAATTLTFDALADFAAAEINETASDNPAVGWIGRASNAATYAGGLEYGSGKYKTILPLEAGANLHLRISYKLVSTDGSGEVINVDNATAVIPAQLAQWSPNYAYTYIFKISDLTNGATGFGPDGTTPVCGLTPITLNAVVVDSEDGIQETITTVNEPSITTYAEGKVVTENNEYNTGAPIYIIVNDGTNNVTVSASNAKLYTATIQDQAFQKISEESVDNALRYGVISGEGKVFTVTDANGKNLVVTDVTSTAATYSKTISADDSPTGNLITLDESNNKATIFTPSAAGTYVFQYIANPTAIVDPVYAAVSAPSSPRLTASQTYYKSTTDATGFTATGNEIIYNVLYTKSGDVYTRFTGTTLTAGTQYYLSEHDNTGFTAVAGDIIANCTYYTKDNSNNYHPVGYLEKDQTYYTSNRGAGEFEAAGTEVITSDTYWTCTNAASVVKGEYKYKVIIVK